MERNETAALIRGGEAVFGLELGSTRIKAVLIGPHGEVLASGSYDWENRLEQGVWTYHMDDVWHGIQESYKNLAASVEEKYGEKITHLKALGFSAMMHGYLAFDREGELLVPFRTWRNTMTEEAAVIGVFCLERFKSGNFLFRGHVGIAVNLANVNFCHVEILLSFNVFCDNVCGLSLL